LNQKDLQDVKAGKLGLSKNVFYFDDDVMDFLIKMIVIYGMNDESY